jgi:phenylacetate-CoA ligase
MDLYTRIFETSVFPLLDRINRTSIAAKLEILLASEHLDRATIQRRQEEAAARVVDLTRRRSTFYRAHWQGAPGPRSAWAPLDGLPIVTKADLRGAEGAFPLPEAKGKILTVRTSGSTGQPMVFYRTLEQDSWFWALRFRIWRWAGYHPGDRYLTINLNPRLGFKKKLQDRLFRCAYLTYNADNLDSERLVDALEKRRIGHLNGFSSSLYVLAQYMLRHNRRARSVVGVTSTGDTLYGPYRDSVEHAFGVRVLDYYGAGGEGVHLASQTLESGSRYLIHPENAVVEFLGAEGPVGPGERGRIVITQFHNEAMPLVRYELGDLAVPAPDDAICPSGRTLPLLESIEGRVPDLIVVPDGTFLVPHFFVVLMKGLEPQIRHYQVVQRAEGRMTMRFVLRPGGSQALAEETVKREVGAATRDLLAVDFEWLDEIPLSGAGKRRLIVSELARQALIGEAP